MATRMQLRRGTASQWSNVNPVLTIAEVGYEIDTNQFKIGDGTNHWADLPYFVDENSLNTSLDGYIESSLLGVANGVATLNSSGQLESSQLPNIDEISQDAINSALSVGEGLTKNYNDSANTISLGVDSNVVATVSGSQTLSNKILGNVVSFGANIDAATYTITNLGSPSNANDAATKAYVDAVAEGLHIHASAVAATTENINLATDLENGDVIDGVTLVTGNRVLVKNQSTASQNGIYVVQASGAAVRAADFDAPAEVHGGDFIFVTGGTVNDNTGWVQTSQLVSVIGTDPIFFTQFSGAGTYVAGNGLTLTGNSFSANIGTDIQAHSSVLDGVAANTYIGSSSITTLGNVSTGTWSATTIALSHGGTGATTQSGAVNAILPSQTSNSGKYLTTDGTNVSWGTVSSDPMMDIFLMMGA